MLFVLKPWLDKSHVQIHIAWPQPYACIAVSHAQIRVLRKQLCWMTLCFPMRAHAGKLWVSTIGHLNGGIKAETVEARNQSS